MKLFIFLFPVLAFSQTSGKLALREAVALALKSNPEILSSIKEIDAASGRILQAGRIPNPEFGVSFSEAPTNFNIAEADQKEFSITQQIEFPTKRGRRIDVSTYDKEIAELQLERTRTLITSEVKKSYYGLLFSTEIVQSIEDQVKLLQAFQQLVTSRFEAGASNYLDVVRSKVEIARTTNDLADANRDLRVRQSQLNVLIGRAGDSPIEPTDSLQQFREMLNQETMLQSMTAKSAILRIAQRSIARQHSVSSLARTSFLPDFTIGVSSIRAAEQPPFNANNYGGVTSNFVGVQLGISVPLWFWQEPRGQVQEADALVEIAEVNNASVARRVRTSIVNALNAVSVAESQLRVFDKSLLADAKDILQTGIAQYSNNQIDVLNLLDIYRTYRATNVEYRRALLNYASAGADLEAANELPVEK